MLERHVNHRAPKVSCEGRGKHVVVVGNIGVGKTTVTQLLAAHLGWLPYFEDPNDNPYLVDFYRDMSRWGFPLQIYNLYKRIERIKEIRAGESHVVQDRSLDEDIYIFAENLYRVGLLSQRDYDCYHGLVAQIREFITPPDLVIYLQALPSTLSKRIKKRGRKYEEKIEESYLEALNALYGRWVASYQAGPLLTVPMDDIDVADNKRDQERLLSYILSHSVFSTM